MKRILVLGGTKFFGKVLVRSLIEAGHEVTIATRGNNADNFQDQVTRIKVDRFSPDSMKEAFIAGPDYDVVFDQICFTPDQAAISAEVFKGRTAHYVFTSSIQVYPQQDEPLTEQQFDPFQGEWSPAMGPEYSYDEGKKWAERIMFQREAFPLTSVRLPPVMGAGSATLQWHVNKIIQGEAIGIPVHPVVRSFISASEAGEFLAGLAEREAVGAINAASDRPVSVKKAVELIGQGIGKAPAIVHSEEKGIASPWATKDNYILNTNKAKQLGFVFKDAQAWFCEEAAGVKQLLEKV